MNVEFPGYWTSMQTGDVIIGDYIDDKLELRSSRTFFIVTSRDDKRIAYNYLNEAVEHYHTWEMGNEVVYEIRRECERLNVSKAELQINDVILQYQNGNVWYDHNGGGASGPRTYWVVAKSSPTRVDTIVHSPEGVRSNFLFNSSYYFILRGGKTLDKGRWNGKCVCGKGTYTGFLQIEHDGVCNKKEKLNV